MSGIPLVVMATMTVFIRNSIDVLKGFSAPLSSQVRQTTIDGHHSVIGGSCTAGQSILHCSINVECAIKNIGIVGYQSNYK